MKKHPSTPTCTPIDNESNCFQSTWFQPAKHKENLKQEILPSNTIMFRTIALSTFSLRGYIRKIRTIVSSTQAMFRARTISTAITTDSINQYLNIFWNLQWLRVHKTYKMWKAWNISNSVQRARHFSYSQATLILIRN